ncbi:hypothetical protein QFC22_005786 [Naganishia vaughanmartiniae]|uniref:Uncharacterized protein n=1 Tax=Naganishia vaughanmartiniae TaxID=1424756 RepID=A0ACC2WT38_9TREE|nr:hypothetical protein QFC22_005786 [Naganishia vaughanmartiniae]
MATTSDTFRPTSRLPLPTSPRVSRIPQPTSRATVRPVVESALVSRSSRIPTQLKESTIHPVARNAIPTPARKTSSSPASISTKSSVASLRAPISDPALRPKVTARTTIPISSTPSRLRNAVPTTRTQSPVRPASLRAAPSVGSLRSAETPASQDNIPNSPSRISIREQIAAKRKALLAASGLSGEQGNRDGAAKQGRQGSVTDLGTTMSNLSTRDQPRLAQTTSSGDIFGRTIPTLIRKALTTGRLDVANMSLERLPKEVWTKILHLSGDDLPLYDSQPTPLPTHRPEEETAQFDEMNLPPHELERRRLLAEDEIMNVPFYEVQDLVVIKASSNSLTLVEAQIGMIGALKNLDVSCVRQACRISSNGSLQLHSNRLTGLPDSIINLRELTQLDMSDNLISAFPACLILAPSLQIVDLSRNSIASISWDNPVRPSRELLQSRKDVSFFDSFPSTPTKSDYRDDDTDEVMPSIRTLSLANNKITNRGLPQMWPRNVEVLDLSGNNLQGVLEITHLATLPRLKRLSLSGNGLTGVFVQAQEHAILWPSLEAIDFKRNEIRAEEPLIDSLRLDRPYTTSSGTDSRGIVQIVLEENPIHYTTIKKVHPGMIARSSSSLHRETIPSNSMPSFASTLASDSYNAPPTGPLVDCWDERQQSIVITRDTPTGFLNEQGEFDLQHILDAVPSTASLKTIDLCAILKLKTLSIPDNGDRFANVTTLCITDTSLKADDATFERISRAMPQLETLNLSGSRIEHLKGVDRAITNGLKRLLIRGCRITDISSLVKVAEELHAGVWKGNLRLEEVDIRDNLVERLEPILGSLPLRQFLVENNAFRVPPRRIWEKEGELFRPTKSHRPAYVLIDIGYDRHAWATALANRRYMTTVFGISTIMDQMQPKAKFDISSSI